MCGLPQEGVWGSIFPHVIVLLVVREDMGRQLLKTGGQHTHAAAQKEIVRELYKKINIFIFSLI